MELSYKKISLIIPCFNEQSFIEQVIRDIINQDFPLKQMEIIFIDGGSSDRSKSIIKKHQLRHKQIEIFDNPGPYVSHALNFGIQNSTGEVIIRLDAHSSYPSNYISGLLYWLQKTKADNVGGSWHIRARKNTLTGKAIAHTLGHPFGAGFASYKQGFLNYEEEVDSVPYGCFPRETFTKFGLFNELLSRNQDIELNNRITRADGRVMLVPNVSCEYFAQSTYGGLWKINFQNGKWVFLTAWMTQKKDTLSLRHYIPFYFILYLVAAIVLSLFIPFTPFSIFLFFPALIYIFLIGRAALSIAFSKDKLEMLPFLAISFFIVHFSFGFGSLAGILHSWVSKRP